MPENTTPQNGNNQPPADRSRRVKTALVLVLILVSVATLFGVTRFIGEGKNFSEMIAGVDWVWLFVLVSVLLLYMGVASAKYAYLLKISTGKFRFLTALKVMLLGRYYDGITPFATGGQPFQIYYLHKKISAGAATAVPLARFIVSMIIWCLFALVFLAVSPLFLQNVNTVTTTMLIIAWVSIGVNLLIPVSVVFISFFPRAGKKLIIRIIRVLHRLRLVRHRYAVSRKYVYEVQEYCNSIKALFTSRYKLLPLILLCIVESATNAAMPFFVALAIADVPPAFGLLIQIVCLNCIAQYSAYLIPTPGNTAAMETTGALVFATVGTAINPVLGWVVLVWRFATYYVYIILGIGINIFQMIRGAVRRKQKA